MHLNKFHIFLNLQNVNVRRFSKIVDVNAVMERFDNFIVDSIVNSQAATAIDIGSGGFYKTIACKRSSCAVTVVDHGSRRA